MPSGSLPCPWGLPGSPEAPCPQNPEVPCPVPAASGSAQGLSANGCAAVDTVPHVGSTCAFGQRGVPHVVSGCPPPSSPDSSPRVHPAGRLLGTRSAVWARGTPQRGRGAHRGWREKGPGPAALSGAGLPGSRARGRLSWHLPLWPGLTSWDVAARVSVGFLGAPCRGGCAWGHWPNRGLEGSAAPRVHRHVRQGPGGSASRADAWGSPASRPGAHEHVPPGTTWACSRPWSTCSCSSLCTRPTGPWPRPRGSSSAGGECGACPLLSPAP